MTKADFIRKAESLIRQSCTAAQIDWEFISRPFTSADGTTKGLRSGYAQVSAPGFRSRRMFASYDPTSGFLVR